MSHSLAAPKGHLRTLLAAAFSAVFAASCARPMPPRAATPGPVLPDVPESAEMATIAFSQRWIEDDYARALAEAKRTHKRVFVDAWASFCHTCLHMRENVLDDLRLRPASDAVVWLAIEVDRPANEAFVKAHAAAALPTFFVLDEEGVERARWVGSMDVEQVERFVRGGTAADPALARVTDLYLAGKHELCANEGLGPPGPEMYARLGVLSTALLCATERVPSLAACAEKDAPAACRDVEELRKSLRQTLTTLLRGPAPLRLEHADDLSSGYEVLVDSAAVEKAAPSDAPAWAALLEELAAASRTKEQRAALDPHRVLAYLAAGTPEKAIPMLEQTRGEHPEDYNPPARLATVYLKLGRYPEADSANAAALGLVYGPRTLRVYTQRADILHAAGKLAEERTVVDEALLWAKGRWLPDGGRRTRAALEARQRSLAAPAR